MKIWNCCFLLMLFTGELHAAKPPNILIAISDDQSWSHASAYGCQFVKTPAFDRIAREGVLFTNAIAPSPGCSPSRAAFLTGRQHWQLEHAGTHDSTFPAKFRTFPEVLRESGYFVGHTGKGWGPGNYAESGRTENPAGPKFEGKKTKPPHEGISQKDYAGNFATFLSQKPAEQPFCFWFGAHEPHRGYQQGSGLLAGKKLETVEVPTFLPDSPEIRSDLLDYAVEIEWFDTHLGQMLDHLEQAGELDNTLIIVTSDNGMAFPRAKANCYEFGIHVPLAIRWGDQCKEPKQTSELVSLIDVTATIYEAAQIASSRLEFSLSGRSLFDLLVTEHQGYPRVVRDAVFAGRERHSSARYLNLSYPQRAMRTSQYLYIRNFRPDRWPAGTPRELDENEGLGNQDAGFHDIDSCPSLSFLIQHKSDPLFSKYFDWSVKTRPALEIYDVVSDPGCLVNLAGTTGFVSQESKLTQQFEAYLKQTNDPRILNGGDIFETYPRMAGIRQFPVPSDVDYYNSAMQEKGWVSLFNRRNLDGWKVSSSDDSFEVINGMIKAQAKQDQSHLFYNGAVNGGDFKDFELLAYVMTTPGSNSGIYFHTEFQEQGFPNRGHEVQINTSHVNASKTGSLFSVKDVSATSAPDDVFYTLYIRVQGKHVTIKRNDLIIVDYTEPEGYQHPEFSDRRIEHGTFALQAHDPHSVVYFREIWVRPLTQAPQVP